MKAKRFIPALVLAGVLSGTAISQAQIICTIPCPIWDFSALIKHIALVTTNKAIDAVLFDTGDKFYKMATRLSQWVSLVPFWIATDDTPAWRIHDWWTDWVIYAKEYHRALTYGDRTGEGFGTVSIPMIDPTDVLLSMGGSESDAAEQLRADVAQAQLADSVIIRGTDETGRIRYGSRAEAQAIDDLQAAVTNESDELSANAAAEKIAAAGLIASRNKQARIQLEAALLEQLLVDSVRERNADARAMNTIVNYLRDGARVGTAGVENAPGALGSYRQP